jgi:3',5'-cyclic AMP phosphodiesterase CpdA
VTARVVHVSDLHVGARDEREVEAPLRELIAALAPKLVVATGDLTHRGRADQHARAAELLRSLGAPVLAVPGNHDIPYTVPARFTRTFAEFERRWQSSEPVFSGEGLVVVGVNSVRAWRHQSGGVTERQLERVASLLRSAPAGALRAVALHHHLTGAPWRTRKRPVSRRGRVLSAFFEAGAELILAGHIHQSAVGERREFHVGGSDRGVTLSIAPGLGQPRPRRRGEARGLHVYDVSADALAVRTYLWRGAGWALAAERRFPRGASLSPT